MYQSSSVLSLVTVMNLTLWFKQTRLDRLLKKVHVVAVLVLMWEWFVIIAAPFPRHFSVRLSVRVEAKGIARPLAP